MQYDFDQVVDRTKNLSAKYDERVKKFGTDDVIPLWIADMDFRTAQPVIDALKARAEEGIWGYTARPASYFEAVKNWQKRRNGWDTDTALMSFSPGVVQTLSVMIRLYTPQNGNVLIQTPVYGEFYDMTELAGRHVIENQLVEQNGTWTVDWADFEEKLRSADIFLLCNPHNPLGIVWTEEELRRMMELCLKHHVLVVSDEIHSDLIFHGKRHIPTASLSPEIAANVVTGISATKTFNLAGAGIAAIIAADPKVRAKIDRAVNDNECCDVNVFGVAADIAAWNQGEEWLEALLSYLQGNLAAAQAFFAEKLPLCRLSKLEGTYLLWADMRPMLGADLDTDAFCESLKTHEKVWAAAGSHYGRDGEGFVRINIATQRALLLEGLTRLAAGAERWQNREKE